MKPAPGLPWALSKEIQNTHFTPSQETRLNRVAQESARPGMAYAFGRKRSGRGLNLRGIAII
jgi:hypothetical protein